MAEDNRLKPMIERRYGLADIARAFEHVASGDTQGPTIIEVAA